MTHPTPDTRPVLRLSCADAPDALCTALAQEIGSRTDGHYTLRIVAPEDTRPLDTQELGVSLVLDGRGKDWIAAHLEWRKGPDASLTHGPSLEMSVMDAALTPGMYARFAENLLAADTEMLALLSSQ